MSEHITIAGLPIEIAYKEWSACDFAHAIGLRDMGTITISSRFVDPRTPEEIELYRHAESGEPLPITVSFGDGSPGYSGEYTVTKNGDGEYGLKPIKPLTRTEGE